MSSLIASKSILGASVISTLEAMVGEGGGVCSRASSGTVPGCDRLRRLLGCGSDSEGTSDKGDEPVEEIELREALLEEAVRAACVTGM